MSLQEEFKALDLERNAKYQEMWTAEVKAIYNKLTDILQNSDETYQTMSLEDFIKVHKILTEHEKQL